MSLGTLIDFVDCNDDFFFVKFIKGTYKTALPLMHEQKAGPN